MHSSFLFSPQSLILLSSLTLELYCLDMSSITLLVSILPSTQSKELLSYYLPSLVSNSPCPTDRANFPISCSSPNSLNSYCRHPSECSIPQSFFVPHHFQFHRKVSNIELLLECYFCLFRNEFLYLLRHRFLS
jgi:hypothetical protein